MSLSETQIVTLLSEHGVKPTANRVTIARTMSRQQGLTTMALLEAEIETIDKSVISRTLTAFSQHGLVHEIADGTGTIKYELCLTQHTKGDTTPDGDDADSHIHFFCEHCRHTYCLPAIHTPTVPLPAGYITHSACYVVHGLCPKCAHRPHVS